MINFASDNVTSASPEVLQAVIDANKTAPRMPYGNDPYTANIEAQLSELFETEVRALLVGTGTAANALALASLTPPWGAIYCHEQAHIQTSECAAPEFYTGGAKLVPLPGTNGKLAPEVLCKAIDRSDSVHHVQPSALSLTQATEAGTIYRPEEVAALARIAAEAGLKVHMDGARFANAVAAAGCSAAEMTWKAGVDVLSFGGTKNGCLGAEAIIYFKAELAENAARQRKRGGHLFSKMRLLTAQFEGYLAEGAWLRRAAHANAMAKRLAAGIGGVQGVELLFPVESNQLFPRFPAGVAHRLNEEGFLFYPEMIDGASRLVTAWSTTEEEVDQFVMAVRRVLEG
ncbi:MAG TPA: beta-eliminating lyase-related protein [Kiloniellales bacterium]|nr:beta-eliminating lyase-related protein [Kiloniellales bacterium]